MIRTITGLLVLAGAAGALGCGSGGSIGWAPLASDQHGVTSITSDGEHVYWTTLDGALRRVSIDGGNVETVASNITNPDHVIVDGTHAYWTMNTGMIARAPKAGGAVEMLAVNQGDVSGLRVDDAHVFWANDAGGLMQAPKTGGQQLTLATDTGRIRSLALTSTSLLWTLDTSGVDKASSPGGAVREVPLTVDGVGGEPSTISAAPAPGAIAANGIHTCWASLDPDALALDPKTNEMQISRLTLDGTDSRVLVKNLQNIDAVVADEQQIYFTTTDGAVNVVSADGGPATTLASGPIGRTSITFDPTSIYWAHTNSDAIFAYPKPQAPFYE